MNERLCSIMGQGVRSGMGGGGVICTCHNWDPELVAAIIWNNQSLTGHHFDTFSLGQVTFFHLSVDMGL